MKKQHDHDSEIGVIGCVLLDPVDCLNTCQETGIDRESFYDVRNRTIFAAIESVASDNKPVNLFTVQSHLQSVGLLGQSGGAQYFSEILDAVPSAANLPYYIELVTSFQKRRDLVRSATVILQSCSDDTTKTQALLDEAEREIMGVRGDKECPVETSLKEVARQVMETIQDRYEGKKFGLMTGYADLDRMLEGLKPGQMFVVAARPSMGKTALAMNIVDNIAASGVPVGVFSLEMSAKALMERMSSSASKVDTLRPRYWSEKDFTNYTAGLVRCAALPLRIEDREGLTVNAIRAKARRWKKKHGIQLLVIDYLQLIKAEGNLSDRRVAVDAISTGLKNLAKELQIPIIVLAQLNREIEKEGANRKPRKSDLRESGQIEQDADIIGMLYDAQPEHAPGELTLSINMLIVKNRNGPVGDVPFTFRKQFTRFESAASAKIDSEDSNYQSSLQS